MSSALVCRDERRRQSIREAGMNGVDYVDVHGDHLCVHFLTEIPQEFFSPDPKRPMSYQEKEIAKRRIVIHGGRRITNLRVDDFDADETGDEFEQSCLGIELDREGDFSTYRLCFVDLDEEGRPTDQPMKSLDPRYACIDFTFKLDCPAEIDCKRDDACPPEPRPRPDINYLAKDYASFRQLILDRLALLMPEWRERHVPDLGIALVEVLAYVGDYLSYYQDAVATEQYLDTARQRISVRRHARLVDYAMHDGANARLFLALEVLRDKELERDGMFFVTRPSELITKAVLRPEELAQFYDSYLVFEPLDPRTKIPVWQAHNLIRIYTWGNQECCIPKGATRASLVDEIIEEPPPEPEPYIQEQKTKKHKKGKHDDDDCPPPLPPPEKKRKLKLQAGDFLLFEELACAGTVFVTTKPGDGGFDPNDPHPQPDVDRTHRHVVRLTKVTENIDPLNQQAVLDVEWSREDALPFQLCVSAIGTAPFCDFIDGLAIARGNIILADHGVTIAEELLPPVPEVESIETCEGEDELSDLLLTPGRYRPTLEHAPLTFSEPLIDDAPATHVVRQDPRAALPWVTLASEGTPIHGGPQTQQWTSQRDLLDSNGDETHFVAEIDDEGRAHLRFGDGELGRAVEANMTFTARYRAGNGRAGLVGAEAVLHVIFRAGFDDVIVSVRNPLPAGGASDPEPVAEVKLLAPGAFRKDLERAITGSDYATLAQFLHYPTRNPRVQSAAGQLRWTGSWYEAGVGIDPSGTAHLKETLRAEITGTLHGVRRMGHDLRISGARIVPLRLELDLCIKPHHLRAHVVEAVREALSARIFPNGRRGFFHPDNLTFGESVQVSRIIAAVMAIDGVAEVHVKRLERLAAKKLGNPDLGKGVLLLARDEVARLDNDPADPENGVLEFRHIRGGR